MAPHQAAGEPACLPFSPADAAYTAAPGRPRARETSVSE